MDDKSAKERFVTGHTGTTMAELLMTTLLLPTNYFCRSVLATFISRWFIIPTTTGSLGGFMLDLFFIVLPTLVSQTFTQAIPSLMILQIAFTMCLLTISWAMGHPLVALHTPAQMESLASTPSVLTTPTSTASSSTISGVTTPVISTKTVAPVNGYGTRIRSRSSSSPKNLSPPDSPLDSTTSVTPKARRLLFVSHYRSSLLLSTAIAILAVDFHIFPRRFVKTEDYGTSLMDTGVGSFVYHYGLTAQQARQDVQSRASLRSLFKSVAPLLFMGLLRLFTHKQIDYQEHTSEYGVHWNFFFTMAAVTLMVWMVHPLLTQRGVAGVLAIGITAAYQYWLSDPAITEYMLHGSRVIEWPMTDVPIELSEQLWRGATNFVAANKEGVYSTIGYFAIFLFALEVGRYALRFESNSRRWWRKLVILLVVDAALWIITFYCDTHIQRVSRRMVNVSYIAWMLAFNLLALSVFLLFNLLHADPASGDSYYLSAINSQMLPAFILSNACTGLTNVTMRTMDQPPLTAFMVLVLYLTVVMLAMGKFHEWRTCVRRPTKKDRFRH